MNKFGKYSRNLHTYNKQTTATQATSIGMASVNQESVQKINNRHYRDHIKILYLPEGYKLTIDFAVYETHYPSLFFIAPNQILRIEQAASQPGQLLFYNRHFYCVQLDDSQVYCDGLLFNNIHNIPFVCLNEDEMECIHYIYRHLEKEFKLQGSSFEEMVRTYLKQLFIKATRLWTRQHVQKSVTEKSDHLEFLRNFTRLVDAHYKYKHRVTDYAELMFLEPKTITHKFKRMNLPQPNEIIKNRIVLEAKRMLVHTSLTVKEIGYDLGYDDPAYFCRLFQIKTGVSPLAFRKTHR